MKKLAIALTTALAGVLVTPVTASAVDDCVRLNEWQQIEYDMRKSTVHSIFDGYPGDFSEYWVTAGNEYDRRYYDPCWLDPGRWAVIKYVKLTTSPYFRVQTTDVQ